MSLYVYVSDLARKDAISYSYLPQIQKFAERVEKTQSADLFDRFPPPHLKKRFERQIRLIAEERILGDDVVICFLRVLVRGGADYASFLASNEVPKGDRIRATTTDAALLKFIASRAANAPLPPPVPDQTENQFLYAALGASANPYDDYVCCETQLWFDRIKEPQFADRISQFQEPVFAAFDDSSGDVSEMRLPNAAEFGFLFRHFPATKTVLLLCPFRGSANRAEVEARYPELVKAPEAKLPHETILRLTRQAYPLAVLENADAWFEIEKDTEGNIALSYEEVEVLQSPRQADEGFPLFINGRAGSGKSTILQYLFADYLYFLFKNDVLGPTPIFFACNDDLITQCKRSVGRILEAKHRLDNGSGELLEPESRQAQFATAFANFHTWLLQLCVGRGFDLDKRMDYAAFKRWWFRRFANEASAIRLYSPDVSWHVIRSYVKGSNVDNFLEPEDYIEIPEPQKSVSPETYQLVFDRVWTKYAADQKKIGLWDDQDLARCALKEELILPKRPVVFCDEAQDFTRIDLEVLLRLSLFSNRTLQAYQTFKVPFAFAGDPFQTLNPTGFRWEATKAHFVEKFVKRHAHTRSRTELNYRELKYNYRSTRNIVLFCNTLQLLRSILFDVREIEPQQPWLEERDSPMPVYFDRSDATVLRQLADESEIRIIVPCDEGGEIDYLTQHPDLDDFVEKDDLGIPKNVVSAMRVKGLEFKRVVLFGFGDGCPRDLLNAVTQSQIKCLSGDRSIDAQYFFNRLYVAASRARRRLFIVDSVDSLHSFWSFATDPERRDEFVGFARNTETWPIEEIGLMAKGQTENWQEDREDALETADKLANDGRLRKDRVLLRQAAQSYHNAGNLTLEQQCRAEALEIEENYLEASEIYINLKRFDDAIKMCWKDRVKGCDKILELAGKYPHLQGRLEYAAASFIRQSAQFDDGLALLKDIENYLEDSRGRLELVTEPAWKEAMGGIKEKLLRIGDENPGTWKVVAGYFDSIAKAGLTIGPLSLGELYFRSDDLAKAYYLWAPIWLSLDDDKRRTIETRYYQAQAAATEYPEKLLVLEKLVGNAAVDAPSAILDNYRRFGGSKLKDEHWNAVGRALIATGNGDELLGILDKLNGETVLLSCLDYFVKSDTAQGVMQSSRNLTILWDREAHWKKILSLWDGEWVSASETAFKLVNTLDDEVHRLIIEAAGNSMPLRTADNKVKTALSERISRKLSGPFDWAEKIHPLIAGAALETCGLFRHILPFYERIEANMEFHVNTRIAATRRWVKAKEGQLRLEGRRRGNRLALEEKMASIGLADPSRVSEFANLVDLPPVFAARTTVAAASVPETPKSVEMPDSREVRFDGLRVTVSNDRRRINLENTDSLEQGTIFVPEKRIILDGVEIARGQDLVEIPTWNYTIDFSDLPEQKLIIRGREDSTLVVRVAKAEDTI